MSEYREDTEDAGLAEGGGSGGGSESVEYERRRVSLLRGPVLIFILVLAVIILLLPVLRIFGIVSIGPALGVTWAIVETITLIIVIFTLYFLFSKNVGASV